MNGLRLRPKATTAHCVADDGSNKTNCLLHPDPVLAVAVSMQVAYGASECLRGAQPLHSRAHPESAGESGNNASARLCTAVHSGAQQRQRLG